MSLCITFFIFLFASSGDAGANYDASVIHNSIPELISCQYTRTAAWPPSKAPRPEWRTHLDKALSVVCARV